MPLKRFVSIFLVLAVLFVLIVPAGMIKGDDKQDFGILTINGKEMYKSKNGETYPIVIFNGEKYIVWHGFDLVSVKDVINCESGKSDMMVKDFTNKYKEKHNNDKSKFYFNLSTGYRAGYNQMYSGWANTRLGFSEWSNKKNWWEYTIGNAGCFLCSTASELLRDNLKDPISHSNVDPVNLNEWLKNNGGFTGANLRFSAVENFPGISYIINGFDDFYGAAEIIYQCAPNAPIECFRSQYPASNGHYWYHFCLYVVSDAQNPYYKTNGLWYLNKSEAPYHKVIDPGFNGSSDPEGTVRTLWQVYEEGRAAHGTYYVRPDSGIFRVAFKD
ncbi:MAG: hypothetical protein GWP10_11445 [Nitrospiraceae bacterium]|nr:hypothetical protein [Nitrospiraceae bacterium]